MTIMNAIIGAAGKMSDKDQEAFAAKILLPGERIVAAFKTKRDSYVFTERRVLFEDVQGLTGKKRSVMSVPYENDPPHTAWRLPVSLTQMGNCGSTSAGSQGTGRTDSELL